MKPRLPDGAIEALAEHGLCADLQKLVADFNEKNSLEVFSREAQVVATGANDGGKTEPATVPTPPRTWCRPSFKEPDVPISVSRELTAAETCGEEELTSKGLLC